MFPKNLNIKPNFYADVTLFDMQCNESLISMFKNKKYF